MTQTIYPYLLYHSCEDALDWLSRAFGFEEDLRYTGEEGYVNHAEMHLGDAHIFMGNPGEGYRNPKEQGGDTVGLYVYVDDVDAHFERAKAAGAEITEQLVDQEYGERRYTALDPEGHKWFFATQIKQVAPRGMGRYRGLMDAALLDDALAGEPAFRARQIWEWAARGAVGLRRDDERAGAAARAARGHGPVLDADARARGALAATAR